MGLEVGLTGAKPIKLNAADKGGAGGAGGGNVKNDLFTTMASALPQRPGATTGGVTPDSTVVVGGSMSEITKDLRRATKLVEKHGIQGSAGQQLQELARLVKTGEIDWNEVLED